MDFSKMYEDKDDILQISVIEVRNKRLYAKDLNIDVTEQIIRMDEELAKVDKKVDITAKYFRYNENISVEDYIKIHYSTSNMITWIIIDTKTNKVLNFIRVTYNASDMYYNVNYINLNQAFTLKEERGKGLFKLLYKAITDEAKKNGFKIIFVDSLEGNPSENVYKSLGFKTYMKNHFKEL